MKTCPLAFEDLPGWGDASFDGAHKALENSTEFFAKGAHSWARAGALSPPEQQAWLHTLRAASDFDLTTHTGFRAYLKTHFQPYQLFVDGGEDLGLFTGYYHPHVRASRTLTKEYATPLYKRPCELVMIEDGGLFLREISGKRLAGRVSEGALVPYFTRADINAGALEGQGLEIAWAQDSVDVFFMMVQGSGTLFFEDGEVLTLHYAGANGHPYTSIGKELIARGALNPTKATAQSVRDWLGAHPQDARALMELNQSYIFFEPSPEPHQPWGALGSPLTPWRSLACDPHKVTLGAPLWVSTPVPWQTQPWNHLMFAQDVGSAIKGSIRADIYCGPGQEGAAQASALNHKGHLFILYPKTLEPDPHGG